MCDACEDTGFKTEKLEYPWGGCDQMYVPCHCEKGKEEERRQYREVLDQPEVYPIPMESIVMADKKKEQVLVFEAKLLDKLGKFQGVMTGPRMKTYLDAILDPANLKYMDREPAEKDPSFKQVIPYTVLLIGREVFRYQRTKKGGENRLHDKWSVGVGGHINPLDGYAGPVAYERAFYRELMEEVSLNLTYENMPEAPIMGLLYDGSDAVGQVHFGVVHFMRLVQNTALTFKDPALSNGHFQHIVECKQSMDNWENWSKLVIDKLLG